MATAASPAQGLEPAREIVAEALFLAQTPPGRAGEPSFAAAPRLQLAAPLGSTLGCTAEVWLPAVDGRAESALLAIGSSTVALQLTASI